MHETLKTCSCSLCGKSFSRAKLLNLHLKSVHGDTDKTTCKFQCQLCNQRFKRNDSLVRHNRVHEKAHFHTCGTCGKKFTQRPSLLRHELLHKGSNPYSCRLCDRVSHDPSVLRRHVINVHKLNPERWREAIHEDKQKND